jgi:hypothetical protein
VKTAKNARKVTCRVRQVSSKSAISWSLSSGGRTVAKGRVRASNSQALIAPSRALKPVRYILRAAGSVTVIKVG